MLLILIILIVALQIGAYRFSNRVRMSYPFLKVFIVFAVLDFSIYPYLFDLVAPRTRLPGYDLYHPMFIYRCLFIGIVIIVITHVIFFLNHQAELKKQKKEHSV